MGSDTIVVGAASDPHTPERTAQTRRRGSSPHHPLHSALTRRSTVSPGEARVGTSPISHIQNMVKDTVRTCNEHMLEEVKEMWRKANDKVCRLLTYHRVVFSIYFKKRVYYSILGKGLSLAVKNEGNVLFNDTLNTYGIRHMVK